MNIFIDTTSNFTIGILNNSFEWLFYKSINTKKSSLVIHSEIQKALEDLGLDLKNDIKNVFSMSGPGSYTGMRVSEGIIQTFKFFNIQTYSVHHFMVPKLLNVDSGKFVSNAFKGEYFLYEWDKDLEKESLVKEIKSDPSYFTHENEFSKEVTSTQKMIHEKAEIFFPKVIELKCDFRPYYYRKLEDEFKPSVKL